LGPFNDYDTIFRRRIVIKTKLSQLAQSSKTVEVEMINIEYARRDIRELM